jgi:hypothetical protein
LVAFVGAGSAGLSVHTGGAISASISWFPLGPGEIYRPNYSHNPRYIQNINQTVVNNTTIINNINVDKHVYVNQHVNNAVTSVPTQTFVRGEHVFPASRPVLAGQLKQMQVAAEAPNVTPDKANRFGDARPRNWQENDQYRSRPVINTPNIQSNGNSNSGLNNNGNNGGQTQNYGQNRTNDRRVNNINAPSNGLPAETNAANQTATRQIEMNDRNSNLNANRPPVTPPVIQAPADVRGNNGAYNNAPQTTIPTPQNQRGNEEINHDRERLQTRQIEQNRAVNSTMPKLENNRELATPPNPTPRQFERNNERSFERQNERSVTPPREVPQAVPQMEQRVPQNERNFERRERPQERMQERVIERPAPVQQQMPQAVPQALPTMPRAESRPPQNEARREGRPEKEKDENKNKAKNEKER